MDLELRRGEVHAVLGENGAGKSTLMHVLVGLVRPDAGELVMDGRPRALARWSPAAAARAGVGMVHQHGTLVPSMTAVENLAFGGDASGFWFDPARARVRVEENAARFELEVPLDRRVEDLSVGERQRVEILRALGRGTRLLILDEPTAALTPGEAQALFPSLRRLAKSGRALVFISHKLDEIEDLADRVTVLRRGRVQATVASGDVEAEALGRLMLGRDLPPLARPERKPVVSGPGFALHGVSAPGLREGSRLRELELEVAPGEIVGVAGIDGNGQRELEEVLAGVRPLEAGTVEVGGRTVAPGARSLRAAGVAQLSGDRESAGLVRGMSVAENLILKGTRDDRRFFRGAYLDLAAARVAAREACAHFGIVPDDPDADIATLSGGNAQKVALARELSSGDGRPLHVLVAVNPTRGLDVGSTRFVHERLLALREAGAAVLLVSTELDEVLSLSDRVVALVRGRLHAVPAGADRGALGAILLGAGSGATP